MLYMSSLELTHFLTASFYPLINTFSIPAPLFQDPGNHSSNLCLCNLCLFVGSTCNWHYTCFFSVWLILLGIIHSRSIQVVENSRLSLFVLAVKYSTVCVCMCVYIYDVFFIYSSVDLCCFRILTEQCYSNQAGIFLISCFHFFWIHI